MKSMKTVGGFFSMKDLITGLSWQSLPDVKATNVSRSRWLFRCLTCWLYSKINSSKLGKFRFKSTLLAFSRPTFQSLAPCSYIIIIQRDHRSKNAILPLTSFRYLEIDRVLTYSTHFVRRFPNHLHEKLFWKISGRSSRLTWIHRWH